MTEQSAVRYERDNDGIVTLTMDDPSASANTMNEAYATAMREAIGRLEQEKDDVTGVVLTSAKKTFFAGGNLKKMVQAGPDDAAEIFAMGEAIKAQLRRLETLGKPVVRVRYDLEPVSGPPLAELLAPVLPGTTSEVPALV